MNQHPENETIGFDRRTALIAGLAPRHAEIRYVAAHLDDRRGGGIEIATNKVAPFLGIELRRDAR
jgi:hypothetical protein